MTCKGDPCHYGWKRIDDGFICQWPVANTKEALFEATGFGAVRVDEPVRGFLGVPVIRHGGAWCELPTKGADDDGSEDL